jgi:hypothetical protein
MAVISSIGYLLVSRLRDPIGSRQAKEVLYSLGPTSALLSLPSIRLASGCINGIAAMTRAVTSNDNLALLNPVTRPSVQRAGVSSQLNNTATPISFRDLDTHRV